MRGGHLRRQRRSHQAQAHARALPPGVRPPPVAGIRRRRHLAHTALRRSVPRENARGGQTVLRGYPVRRGRLERVRRRPFLHRRRYRRCPPSIRIWQPSLRKSSRPAPHRRQRPFLSLDPAQPICAHRPGDRRGRLGKGQRLAAARGRKALRPRPRQRARAQRPPARSLPRSRRLPHRPLPRQGDRAEHPGLPLRQRHLRAAVEPPLRELTCRSPPPNRSASRAAAPTTRRPARCAT